MNNAAAAAANRREATKMVEDQGLLCIRDAPRKRPAWVSDDVIYLTQSEVRPSPYLSRPLSCPAPVPWRDVACRDVPCYNRPLRVRIG